MSSFALIPVPNRITIPPNKVFLASSRTGTGSRASSNFFSDNVYTYYAAGAWKRKYAVVFVVGVFIGATLMYAVGEMGVASLQLMAEFASEATAFARTEYLPLVEVEAMKGLQGLYRQDPLDLLLTSIIYVLLGTFYFKIFVVLYNAIRVW